MKTPTPAAPRPGDAELRGLRVAVTRQTRRLSMMQMELDAAGESLIRSVSVNSASDAGAVARIYDSSWFRKTLYSSHVRVQLARTLIAAVAEYPFVDTSVWQTILGEH